MADKTNTSTTRTPVTTTAEATPVRRAEHAPDRAGPRAPILDGVGPNGRPSDPGEMREEIDRTRQRMSYTLDTIEDRLVRQKEEIWAKATFQGLRRTISTEPWRSVAIAFAVGYIVAAIRD